MVCYISKDYGNIQYVVIMNMDCFVQLGFLVFVGGLWEIFLMLDPQIAVQ